MLTTAPNLAKPDETYAALLRLHEGLTEAESHALNARLLLILINHIGDEATLAEAMRRAKKPGAGGPVQGP